MPRMFFSEMADRTRQVRDQLIVSLIGSIHRGFGGQLFTDDQLSTIEETLAMVKQLRSLELRCRRGAETP